MSVMEFPEVPDAVMRRARAICRALPETTEVPTDYGAQFNIRRRTFAYVFAVEGTNGAVISMLSCNADPDEREVLLALGHPFFAPWARDDRVGVVIDDATDWTEVAELLTESYRQVAPKKLAATVLAPP